MEKIDLIKPDTLKDLLFKKFEDAPPLHEEVDPLSNGDFEVIKQLLATVPDAVRAKEKMDKIMLVQLALKSIHFSSECFEYPNENSQVSGARLITIF